MRHVERTVLIIIVALSVSTYGFSGGDGTPGAPYQIATAQELLSIGSDPDLLTKYYLLAADIDLDPNITGLAPFTAAVIAPDLIDSSRPNFDGAPFTGSFDGGGHTIWNLNIDTLADGDPVNNGNDFLGLIGNIDNGRIQNLRLANVQITGGNNSWYLGGLVGYSCKCSTIIDCFVAGSVVRGNNSYYLGGLVGVNDEGSIINCTANAGVMGDSFSGVLGGLAGGNYNSGAITNCSATGRVAGGRTLGGLVGYNESYSTITNSYATGNVDIGNETLYDSIMALRNGNDKSTNAYTADNVARVDKCNNLGGLVGYNYGVITDSYANGSVTGDYFLSCLGGLVGCSHGTITHSYASGRVTGGGVYCFSGGLVGDGSGTITHGYFLHPADGGGPINGIGEPLTDTQMRWQANFVGWDFVGDDTGTENNWQMCLDGLDYPRLAWQFSMLGDFINPGRVDNYDLYVLAGDWLSVSSRCGDIAPPESPDGIVNLLDYTEFARHWLDVSLLGANQVDNLLPYLWTPPRLVLAWNANPRILVPYVSADKLTMYYSRYHEDQWQILQTSRVDPAAPFPVGQVIPELTGGLCPWLSTDGLRMYYSMDVAGDRVMQLAERADTGSPWQHVRALTEVHAAGSDDSRPSLTADELTLFWTSSRFVDSE
ncbi:MAG: hypothetical protein JW810_11755, partial [Sedimentisphaerales bacterium]|nr:hypothetical protein [Sedimentisphaerales bacterium]